MSSVTRDRSGTQPPLTRGVRPVDPKGRWEWPDPIEVPQSAHPQALAATVPLAARWECEPLPAWPPAPKVDVAALADPYDDFTAIPSAVYTPQGDARAAPSPQPAAARGDAAPAGGRPFAFGWTSGMMAIPAESQTRSDPSPSRLSYRMHRLWLTPTVRHFVRVGLPILLMVVFVTVWLADEARRQSLVAAMVSVRTAIEDRPQFQVNAMTVSSRSPEVAQGVEQLLAVHFPESSWRLDLEALRGTAEALDAVHSASVQVREGVLEVTIEERLPAMIWRNGNGLNLVDATGHRVARLANRAARADLPLIAGAGAPEAIAEAHLLWAAAAPLRDRVRGLVRVGERRWDVVLDRDQRILLPAEGALGALERVMALNMAQDILARDVRVVDLRNPTRPTLRLSPDAMDELTRIRRASSGAPNR